MYAYSIWPGAYSFKEEIGLFMTYIKEQVDDLLKKIEETEKVVEEAQLFNQGMKEIFQ